MDDASPEHIAALKKQAQLIIDDNEKQLGDLCKLLTDDRPPPRALGPAGGISAGGLVFAVETATRRERAKAEPAEEDLWILPEDEPRFRRRALRSPRRIFAPSRILRRRRYRLYGPELPEEALYYKGPGFAFDYELGDDEPGWAAVDPSARYVNLAISDGQQRVLPKPEPLRPKQSYFVRIDICPLTETSLVENPVDVNPAAEQFEPDIEEGYWLDAVLSSPDVDVQTTIGRVFLPVEGASWVCGCVGEKHGCWPFHSGALSLSPVRDAG